MSNITRRKFIKSAAGAGLFASSAPLIMTKAQGVAPPSELVNVAVVGINGQGGGHASTFARMENTRLVAVCDVDFNRAREIAKRESVIKGPVKAYIDFRKMLEDKSIDAVSIATCDHWHTPVALAAIMAGKHVYVEKPSSHTVHEGNLLIKAAREYRKCVQHGTQRRSSAGHMAVKEAINKGIIGECYMAKAINCQDRGKIGRAKPEKPPEGVYYDMWLGPAPVAQFTRNRWHYEWHWFWDYGGGDLVNDGIHHLDLAVWGMGLDKQYPKEIVTSGGQLWYDDDHETPDTQLITYVYDKVQIIYEMRLWTDYGMPHFGNATVFYGTEGYIHGRTAYRDNEKIRIKPEDYGVESPGQIMENFIDAIKADDPTMLTSHIEKGGVLSNLCCLGNIGTRLGNATLTYSDETQSIVKCSKDIDKANALLTKEYRKPYTLAYTG
jgi:predicted dehydrogenase